MNNQLMALFMDWQYKRRQAAEAEKDFNAAVLAAGLRDWAVSIGPAGPPPQPAPMPEPPEDEAPGDPV